MLGENRRKKIGYFLRKQKQSKQQKKITCVGAQHKLETPKPN